MYNGKKKLTTFTEVPGTPYFGFVVVFSVGLPTVQEILLLTLEVEQLSVFWVSLGD